MKCEKENCGADIATGAKFCSVCGTRVIAPTAVKKAICSCSNLVLEVHSFCLNCGLKVDPSLFTGNACIGTKNDGEKCYTVLPPGTNFCPFCGTAATQEDSGTTLEAASLKDNELSNQQKSSGDDSSRLGSSSHEIWSPPGIVGGKSTMGNDVEIVNQSVLNIDSTPSENKLLELSSISDNIKNIGENAKDQQEECAEKLDETTEQVIDDTRKEGKTLFISMYQNEIPSQTRDCKEVYLKVLQETEVKDAIDDTKLISGEGKVQDAAYYTEMDSGECQRNNKKDETSKTAEDHFPCIQKSDVGNQSHTEKEFSQIKTLDIPAESEQKFLDLQRCGIKRSHEPDIVLVTEKRRKEFTTEKFPATENLNLIDTDACDSSNNDAIIIADSKSESGDTKLSSGEENVDIDNVTIKRKAEENKSETKRIKTEGKSVSTEDSMSAETEQFGIQKTGESITDELAEIQLNKTGNKSNRDESHEVPKPEKANSLDESQDVTNTTTSSDEPNGNTENIKERNKILTRSAAKAIKDATTKNEIGSQTQEDFSEKGKKEQEASNESTQQENTFKVFFHAIMHASVYDESCVTYVRFSLDVLGGWKSKRHELYPVRKLDNGNIEVGGVVSIPRGFLESSIWYKYIVVCGNMEQEEYIFNKQNNTRRLFVASKLVKTSAAVFHQYDGVVKGVETKESFFSYIKYLTGYEESQYKNLLAMDALESAQVFLPVWNTTTEPQGQAGPCMGEEMITAVNAVWRGLKRCYCKTKAVTEKDLSSLFKEAIMGRFVDLFKDFAGRNYFSGEEKKKIFINAVTVTYLFKEFDFGLSYDDATALCGALLPDMELEEKQNSCIENIKEMFPQTFKYVTQQKYIVRRMAKRY